jgi:DNA-binding MarR family transcriptional regulator
LTDNKKAPFQGDPYVRFLRLSARVPIPPQLDVLDPLEERLLAWLALATAEGDEVSVRQIMARDEFGAPATIHARVTGMRRKGWIILVDTEDARRKNVELTRAARRHFERLSRCMLAAARH